MDKIRLDQIEAAEWEPRTPEELSPDHPAMKELIDSIAAQGVIQPVALWVHPLEEASLARGGYDRYVCIAGNRRVIAARVAGLTEIPAVVFDGIDEARARAITRAENEIRLGVSPLADAQLIGQLKDTGRSQAEIAAMLGTSEPKVCRRAKLLALTPEVRAFFEEHVSEVDVRAMEDFASYKPELQKEAVKRVCLGNGRRLTSSGVKDLFRVCTRVIDPSLWLFKTPGGPARLERCMACAKNAACQQSLPGFTAKASDEAAVCQDIKCWEEICRDAKREALAAALVATGGDAEDAYCAIERKYQYELNAEEGLKKRKSKKNCVARAYWNYAEWEVKWGEDPESAEAKAARKAAKAEKKAEKERMAEIDRRRKLTDSATAKAFRFLCGDLDVWTAKAETVTEICIEHLKEVDADDLAEALAFLIARASGKYSLTEYSPLADWACRVFGADRMEITPEERAALKDSAKTKTEGED